MDPQTTPQAPVQSALLKIGKFAASTRIVHESWNVLKQDKEMMWFPVLSAIVSLIVFALFGAFIFSYVLGGDWAALETIKDQGMSIQGYAFLFAYYLVTFFIVNFFQAGVFLIAHARFNGRDIGFSDGLNGAFSHTGRIFMWSLISATVGVVLQAIADRWKFVGTIVSMVLGAAWGILTYFSLLSLIIGNTSVPGAFKESASLIRKTWGETIIVNFGVGLFFAGLFVLGAAAFIALALLVPEMPFIIALVAILIIYFVLLSIVSSTLSSIFKLALYEYARTGAVPQGFSPELVRDAVKKGEEKKSFLSGFAR